MSFKMTSLIMESTDKGAFVSFTSNIGLDIKCPRCGVQVLSGKEHRCGNRVLAETKRILAETKGKPKAHDRRKPR